MAICKNNSIWYKYNNEVKNLIYNIQSRYIIILLYKRKLIYFIKK